MLLMRYSIKAYLCPEQTITPPTLPMIDRATVDRIIDATRIEEVVSDFVTLRKRGVNYVGLCPFHDDKNPSFYVSPTKGVCKCFSCGKGGNAVHFIMEHEQMTYVEALKYLAKKYGIEVKERDLTDEERQAQNDRESLFLINQFARDFFCRTLRNHEQGRAVGMAYFRNRGFRDDIIEKFQLGYCPDSHDALSTEAIRKGYKKDYLLKTGLCYETDDHRLRDRFSGRVIFPVHTLSGKVVAFGGRVLSSATKGIKAKYVNSIESEIYHKSDELYGIYLAKQAIVKQDRCYLVEGYTDVISMFQSGIENVVASSGTSLTQGQIKLIRRFTSNITVLYDGDEAGIKASLRGIDLLLEKRLNVKVCLLPDGDDPDSLARRLAPRDLQAFLNEHETDFIRFKTRLLLKDAGNDPIRRAQLVGSVVDSIAVIPEAITRDIYIKECAQILNMEDRLLVNEVARRREAAYRNRQAEQQRRAEQEQRQAAGSNAQQPTTTAEKGQDNGQKTSGPSEENPLTRPATPHVVPPQTPKPTTVRLTSREERLAPYERTLLQALVRYGEQMLYVDSEDPEGETTAISVVDYIAQQLEMDQLELCIELHRRILAEAKANVRTANFSAAHFFRNHPDPEISRLCADLLGERYELSKYHAKQQQVVSDKDRLFELVPTLLMNYKYAVIAERLKQIETQLQDPAVCNNADLCAELMTQYNELRSTQSLMAQALGDRVVMRV